MTTAIAMTRQDPKSLVPVQTGRVYPWMIYAADCGTHSLWPQLRPDLEFLVLSAQDLRALPSDDTDFQHRQLERLTRFGGTSYAYGIFMEGKVVHISWLLPSEVVRSETPRLLQLRKNGTEITGCETVPED